MEGKELIKKSPELSLEIIKKYICPQATDQEAYMFLQLCKSQNLNPFLREAYLIKYGTAPATIVTGKETFTKRADRLPQYDGFKAGIILQSNNQIVYREGSFYTSDETLLGGWAEVYRKDRSIPFRNEVKLEEYEGHKNDGTVNKMWKEKKGTMIRKVPLMQSLREAFPDEFGGMYSPEEINTVDTSNMPQYEEGKELQHPHIQPPLALKQPQKQAEMPLESKNTTKGIVQAMDIKTGAKGTKKWTLYIITIDDLNYSTFDKKLAEVATGAHKTRKPVVINYEETEKGRNLTSIAMEAEEAEETKCNQCVEYARCEREPAIDCGFYIPLEETIPGAF